MKNKNNKTIATILLLILTAYPAMSRPDVYSDVLKGYTIDQIACRNYGACGYNIGAKPVTSTPAVPAAPAVVTPPVVNYPADTEYDGIYSLSDKTGLIGYAYLRSLQGQMIIVINNEIPRVWEASQGVLNKLYVQVTTVRGDTKSVTDINFTSTSNFQLKQISCAPNHGASCLFENGAIITGTRIW